MNADTVIKEESRVSGYSWYALSLLTLVYVFNYLDRTIIYILLPLIKREMAFTDLQLALLGSMNATRASANSNCARNSPVGK